MELNRAEDVIESDSILDVWLTVLKPHPPSFPFATHLGKAVRRPLLYCHWHQQEDQTTQTLESLGTFTSAPSLNHSKNHGHLLFPLLKAFWTYLSVCPALPRKPHYMSNKHFHIPCLCVCVCVCERERERERDIISLDIWTNFRQRALILHSAKQPHNRDLTYFYLIILPFSISSLHYLIQYGCSSSCHHIHIPVNGKRKRGRDIHTIYFQSTNSKLHTLFLFMFHWPQSRSIAMYTVTT